MITRAQIRRQLRQNGGIMNAVPRQGYGIGDWVRKLIPKEIAKVSQVAAPFVAPFNPLAGAAMAGLGGFKQTGNLGRSLGAAALTGGLGAGARYLGGAKQILPGIGGFSSPLSVGKTASLFGTPGHMSRNTGWMKGTEGFLDKLGLTKGGGSMKMTPLGMISGASLLTYFMQKGATEEEAEELARDVYRGKGLGMNQIKADMQKYRSGVLSASQAHDKGYHFLTPRNYLGAQGGRVGLYAGTPKEGIKSLEAGASPITIEGDVRPENMKMASLDPKDPIYKGINPKIVIEFIQEGIPLGYSSPQEYFEDFYGEIDMAQGGRVGLKKGTKGKGPHGKTDKEVLKELYPTLFSDTTTSIEGSPGKKKYYKGKAQGGRIGKYGGGIGAAMPRIPTGMPRVNAGGITELDYRQEGGFVPVGVKEKADDVPAMLSKNEFVMTADAVKAAGGGDVEKGAQRMYDTMKQLEGRVA